MGEDTSNPYRLVGLLRGMRRLMLLVLVAAIVVPVTVGYNVGGGYYYLCFAAVVPFAAYFLFRRGERRISVRYRATIRWARSRHPDEKRDYAVCRKYLESLDEDGTIDRTTWTDLDLDIVVSEMDTCFSSPGRNELFRLVSRCIPSEGELERRMAFTERMRTDEGFRTELLSLLLPLEESIDHDPFPLLESSGSLPPAGSTSLYVIMSAAVLLSPLVLIFGGTGVGIFFIIGMVLANMWIYYRKSAAISSQMPLLRGLFRIVLQARRIAAQGFDGESFDFASLKKATDRAASFERTVVTVLTGAAGTGGGASADLLSTFTIYLKVIFLVDLIAYNRVARGMRRFHREFRTIYESIGRLDALHSIASFLERTPGMCRATFTGDLLIDAEKIYHPLVRKAVANDVHLVLPGAVVTGTNMAGKSTLLRTVGINALLAQTIGHCFAASYRAARFYVMTSIDKTDDLASGKSFYYTEAERIFRMTEQADRETPVLLLIDELLAGTNSLERESASVAILTYLARKHAITVSATHAVAVAKRVEELYAPYFLTDKADDTGLSFDYRLRPGIVETRNAIRLLAMIGYPKDIVDAALEGSI